MDLDPTAHAAVDLTWEMFRTIGRWPSRKDFLLRAIDSGLSLPAVLRCSAISLRAGGGEEVRPKFEALVVRPEVRELLRPLPSVLRFAASAFVAQAPALDDHQLPQLHLRDVKRHWSDPTQAAMALKVVRDTSSGFLVGSRTSGTDPEDVSFSISVDYLRYEHVQDLEDVLDVRQDRRTVDPGPYPSGQHLQLLLRIHAASMQQGRWPRGLPFAIAARDVGYVPQLASELHPRFALGVFQAAHHHSVVLTLEALRFVDPSGDYRTLLAKAVRGVVDLWRAGAVEIPLAQLAASLEVAPERLGPIVAFLELSQWCSLGHVKDDGHVHIVLTPGEPELVLRNLGVDSFDEYMNKWDEQRDDAHGLQLPLTLLSGAEGQEETPQVPKLPFDFVKNDRYHHILEADLGELRRVVESRAWKASLILIGGIIECTLLDVLSRREDISQSQLRKQLGKASLTELIEAGVDLELVPDSVKPFAEVAKDYRDLVHPFRSGVSPLRPTVESVRAMLHALELIVKNLEQARQDGRLSRFESL